MQLRDRRNNYAAASGRAMEREAVDIDRPATTTWGTP